MQVNLFDCKNSDLSPDEDLEDNLKIQIELFKRTKHKKLVGEYDYDFGEDRSFYTIDFVGISERSKRRTSYFDKYRRKFNLPRQVESLYIKLLNFSYFKESINHKYFIKKVCDYLGIPNDLKINKRNIKYEIIWNDFLKIL